MQTQNDRTVDALMAQLIESGPDGLAAAFVAMLNLAMRMERERANGTLASERSAARTAYGLWLQAQEDRHPRRHADRAA
jgi:hypothetical protein